MVKTMKKISFLLPCYAIRPIGGLKVIFEYANRLCDDNMDIHIFYPMNLMPVTGVKKIKRFIAFFIFKLFNIFTPKKWFILNKKIKQHLIWDLSEKFVINSDIYIATGVQTAFELNKYKNIKDSKLFYLVQGFEDWIVPKEQVLESYRFPFTKIAISPWLQEIIKRQSENVFYVPNGLNFHKFYLKNTINSRNPKALLTLFHQDELKRSCDAIDAIKIVKSKIPDIEVSIFGVPSKPENLPEWINYYQNPSQEKILELYNNAAIYIAASRSEGFGLTLAEAMQCGCAVVCTDIGGYSLFAKDNETALLNEVYNVNKMAENIQKLIINNDLRYSIAFAGNENIKQFTWEKSYLKFKEIISR